MNWQRYDWLMLICGHYEGVDERIREHLATDEISIGDYVLTGGELAAMVVADAVVRLLPGVLGSGESLLNESHTGGLLEYPQYTRPEVFRDWSSSGGFDFQEIMRRLPNGDENSLYSVRHNAGRIY